MTDVADKAAQAGKGGRGGSAAESYAELLDGLRATFRSGRTRSLDWRLEQLRAMDRMLVEQEADFTEALREDLGRPPIEAYTADLAFTRNELAYTIKRLPGWVTPEKARTPLTSQPGKSRIIPEPLGVALVIAPWNYPIQLLLAPVAGAISAGNCVVAKPSELSPACSAALARHIPRYLDDEAITVVEGAVPETTALLELPWDHIFFTGSTIVGKVVMAAAAPHLTPVTLELGGKSPAIVAADADLGVAARRVAFGKNLNAGQTCIAPDYVLVEASVRDAFVDELVGAFADFHGRDTKASGSLSRIINDRHFSRLIDLLDGAGGSIATGGERDASQRFLAPTVVVDPDLDAKVMQEEIFGPILPVVSVGSIDEAVDFVNDRPKPLALYVFSSSGMTVDRVLEHTSSGGACVNHTLFHINTPELPFGGVGPSGMGAYHGKASFDVFSHHKSVLYKPQKPDPKLVYPPYTGAKEKLIRKVL